MSDLDLIGGIFAKEPHEKAPDFVKARMSVKLADLASYMRQLKAEDPDIEWLNFDVKVARSGKWYCARDNWKPQSKAENTPKAQDDFDSDVPF